MKLSKKLIVFSMLLFGLIICTSACTTHPEKEVVVVDKKYIQKYSDVGAATTLLEETWKPLIRFIKQNSDSVFKLEDFYNSTTNISENFLDYLVDMTMEKNTEDGYEFHQDLWFPTILDKEATIDRIEIIEQSEVLHGFILIIEETGNYVDLNYGYRRENIFYFDENGKPILLDVRGSLFKAKSNE